MFTTLFLAASLSLGGDCAACNRHAALQAAAQLPAVRAIAHPLETACQAVEARPHPLRDWIKARRHR